jgi:hypothetical protein
MNSATALVGVPLWADQTIGFEFTFAENGKHDRTPSNTFAPLDWEPVAAGGV